MERSNLKEFHQKFARAGAIDFPDQSPVGSEAAHASATLGPKRVEAMRNARLRVIAEYLEPLEDECTAEEQRAAVRAALVSLPPSHVVDKVLRYQGHLDRRVAALYFMLRSEQGRARLRELQMRNEPKKVFVFNRILLGSREEFKRGRHVLSDLTLCESARVHIKSMPARATDAIISADKTTTVRKRASISNVRHLWHLGA